MKQIPLSPSQIIILALVGILALGTALLMLPFSQTQPLPFIDVLFTCVSAATGGGALTISLSNFTTFGLIIIMVLMQLSAIGFIGLILYLLYRFFDINEGMALLARDLLGLKSRKQAYTAIRYIITSTIVIELIGIASLFYAFMHDYSYRRALFMAVFHTISAFTNTGLALIRDSIAPYTHNHLVLLTLTALMLLGGAGFIVIHELQDMLIRWFKSKKISLSLSTKITLSTFATIILFGSAAFWYLEGDFSLSFTSKETSIMNAIFNAVSCINTGFSSVATAALSSPLLLLIMIIAFIGASPGSAGSGIKTTTAALFLGASVATLRGKPYVTLFGKRIARDQMYKAITIVTLSIIWILISTFILSVTENQQRFIEVLFETVSSFTTLGLTTNLTPNLSTIGKIVVMFNLIIGKIGSVTFIFAIQKLFRPNITTPRERVLLS